MDRRNKSENIINLHPDSNSVEIVKKQNNSSDFTGKNNLSTFNELNRILTDDNIIQNKNFAKLVIGKFHEFSVKITNKYKLVINENNYLKEQITPKKLNQVHDLVNDDSPNKIEDCTEQENRIIKMFIEEELECFNQILIELNSQFNEMQLKEENLRKQLLEKCNEVNRLLAENEELKSKNQSVINEFQNIALKLNDYQDLLHNLKGNENQSISFNRDDDLDILLNKDNYTEVINRLVEENKQLKVMVSKLKEETLKGENELSQILIEFENFENFKKYILTYIKELSLKNENFQITLDKFSEKYRDLEFTLQTKNI